MAGNKKNTTTAGDIPPSDDCTYVEMASCAKGMKRKECIKCENRKECKGNDENKKYNKNKEKQATKENQATKKNYCVSAQKIARNAAIEKAWNREAELIKAGFRSGDNNWTETQQLKILLNGSVPGYDGHHMWPVSQRPDHAGCWKTIQFIRKTKHRKGESPEALHDLFTDDKIKGYYNGKEFLPINPTAFHDKDDPKTQKIPATQRLKTALKVTQPQLIKVIMESVKRVAHVVKTFIPIAEKDGGGKGLTEITNKMFLQYLASRLARVGNKGKMTVNAEALENSDEFNRCIVESIKKAYQGAADSKIKEKRALLKEKSDAERAGKNKTKNDENRETKIEKEIAASIMAFNNISVNENEADLLAKLTHLWNKKESGINYTPMDLKTRIEKEADDRRAAKKHFDKNKLPCNSESQDTKKTQ